MKVRDSGMPEVEYWESLFDIPLILDRMNFSEALESVVEFGSGYGTFTIPVAKLIKGKVYAFDFESEMIGFLELRSGQCGIDNIILENRDFIESGTGLLDNSADYVMLFNILHHNNPIEILTESRRILKTSGTLGIIHWNYDPDTPRGPHMDIRPKPGHLLNLVKNEKFSTEKGIIDLPPYHYGILGNKL